VRAKKRPRLGEVRVAESAGEREWIVMKNPLNGFILSSSFSVVARRPALLTGLVFADLDGPQRPVLLRQHTLLYHNMHLASIILHQIPGNGHRIPPVVHPAFAAPAGKPLVYDGRPSEATCGRSLPQATGKGRLEHNHFLSRKLRAFPIWSGRICSLPAHRLMLTRERVSRSRAMSVGPKVDPQTGQTQTCAVWPFSIW
jgi:hypothetical protein